MVNTEKKALDAYLTLLKEKDVPLTIVQVRTQFLKKLSAELSDKVKGREVYADALNDLVNTFAYDEWQHCTQAAREFYPFWMRDQKAINDLKENYYFNLQVMDWQPLPTTLDQLAKCAEVEVFSEEESLLLEQYLKHLQTMDLEKNTVLARVKLAKILLIRLRHIPAVNNVIYRKTVDVTLPLFKLSITRQIFLGVVREFFHIWIASADANKQAVA